MEEKDVTLPVPEDEEDFSLADNDPDYLDDQPDPDIDNDAEPDDPVQPDEDDKPDPNLEEVKESE